MAERGSVGRVGLRVGAVARMKVALLGAILGACAVLLAPAAAGARPAGTIEGTLTSAANGQPIAYAKVCAVEADRGMFGECELTGAAGHYALEGLKAGSYKVYFENRACPPAPEGRCLTINYLSQYYGGAIGWAGAAVVTVATGGTVAKIDGALEAGGQVSGTVTDSSGNPLPGAEACALEAASGEPYEPGESYVCVQAGSGGHYTLEGLATGAYKIGFSGECCNGPFVQFSGGHESFGAAHLVAVTAGAVTSGVDSQLSGATISGTVTDPSEAGLDEIEVCAERVGAQSEGDSSAECVFTGADGAYEARWLPAGTYRVSFQSQCCEGRQYETEYYSGASGGAPEKSQANTVSLTAGQTLTDIDAQMTATGEISGEDEYEGNPSPGFACAVDEVEGALNEVGCGDLQDDGTYAIEGLPKGTYKIVLVPFFSNAAVGYYGGSTFAEAEGVKVLAGENHAVGNYQFDEQGWIEGTLTAPGGGPASDVVVCAYESGRRPLLSEPYVECDETGQAGEYTIPALAETRYDVRVQPEQERGCAFVECRSPAEDYAPLIRAGVQVKTGKAAPSSGALSQGASITGAFLDTLTGTPVGGEICAFETSGEGLVGEEGGGEEVACNWLSQTGQVSEYRLEGLAPGSYKLELWIYSYNYATPLFSGGQRSFASAGVVNVSAGGHATANFALAELYPAQPVNTAAPTLSGTPAAGQTLFCAKGSWAAAEPTAYSYAWSRDGSTLAGQAGTTYVVQSADEGHLLSCAVTAANAAGAAAVASNSLAIPFYEPASTMGVAKASAVARVKHGKARLKLRCTGDGPCKGEVKLTVKLFTGHIVKRHGKRRIRRKVHTIVLGKARFSIAQGKREVVSVKLTHRAKKLLAKAGRHGLNVRVGGTGVTHRNITLKLRRKHKSHGKKHSTNRSKDHGKKHGKQKSRAKSYKNT